MMIEKKTIVIETNTLIKNKMLISKKLLPGKKLIWEEVERIQGHAKKYYNQDGGIIRYPVIVKETCVRCKDQDYVISFKTDRKRFTAHIETDVPQLREPTKSELNEFVWPRIKSWHSTVEVNNTEDV